MSASILSAGKSLADDEHVGYDVLQLARAVSGSDQDPVPDYGDFYSFLGFSDPYSFAQEFSCKLQDNDDPTSGSSKSSTLHKRMLVKKRANLSIHSIGVPSIIGNGTKLRFPPKKHFA